MPMMDNDSITKLTAWVQSHPESADTPFMNVSTGEEFTVRGLLNVLQASKSGEVELTDSVLHELNQVETWIGAL